MKRNWFSPLILVNLFFVWAFFAAAPALVLAQQPTITPTYSGMFITVMTDEPFANIRMGPSSTIYPKVGILYPGDTAPALGRSSGGDWIQIAFPGAPYDKGWVYSPLVQVSPGILQVVEPPPTPVPPATATIDPTLAAQFIIIPTSTRMPTFTPPPSLVAPLFLQTPSVNPASSVSTAVIILALMTLGLIGFLLSLISHR